MGFRVSFFVLGMVAALPLLWPSAASAQRYQRPGYSVTNPAGPGWRLIANNQKMIAFRRQYPPMRVSVVVFGRKMRLATPGLAGLRRLAVRVAGGRLPTGTVRRHVAGASCLYLPLARPTSNGQYRLLGGDLFCLHPRNPRNAVWLGFSQRYPIGGAPIATGPVQRRFFNSLHFR